MERWTGKVAIVTGASSGIGAAIAKVLVEKGLKVVGLARRLNRMQDMQSQWQHCTGTFYPQYCDVSKEDDILKAFKWTIQNLGGIDIMVNNAGIAISESIIGGTVESYRKILDVNTVAVAICSREAIKSMKERKVLGHIVNINSILGQTTAIKTNPISFYAPSKHALTALSAIIQKEIHEENLNIKVTNISPGVVKTEIAKTVGRDHLYETLPYIEAADIADSVVYVLSTPANVLVSELTIVPLNKETEKMRK